MGNLADHIRKNGTFLQDAQFKVFDEEKSLYYIR